MTLRIEKFVPFRFCKRQLELTGLSALTGKNWRYSSSGKASLYHCLKSLNIQLNLGKSIHKSHLFLIDNSLKRFQWKKVDKTFI